MHPDFTDLQSLVDEELDPIDRYTVSDHLRSCGRCRDATQVLRDVAQSLAAIPRAEPPNELPERIIAACAQATPVPSISCDASLAMVSDYIDDELGGLLLDTLEAHLFSCESCYAAYRGTQRTAELLRSTPPAAAPVDLHERISAAIEREETPAPVFAWRRVAPVFAAAAAAAILLGVFLPRGGDLAPLSEPQLSAVSVEAIEEPSAVTEVAEVADEAVASEPEPTPEVREAAAGGTPAPTERQRPAPRRTTRATEIASAPATQPAPRTTPSPSRAQEQPSSATEEAGAAYSPRREQLAVAASQPTPPASVDASALPRGSEIARTPQPAPATREVPVAALPPATQPAPQPVTAADRDHQHIAVVPVRTEERTLYRASDEPPTERIARATRAVNTEVGRPRFDDSGGLEIR